MHRYSKTTAHEDYENEFSGEMGRGVYYVLQLSVFERMRPILVKLERLHWVYAKN